MSKCLKYTLLSIVFILGYASLSFELIVLRQLINFVGSNTLITSIVITFILLFMSIGYYFGSVIKFKQNVIRDKIQKMILTLNFIFILASSYYIMQTYFVLMYKLNITNFLLTVTIYSTIFLALPSVFMGFITSVIGRIIHHYDVNYTGRFMAVDTFGSVAGSIATTLIFMPFLSVSGTIVILVLLTSLSLIIISKRKDFLSNAILAVLFIVMSFIINNEKIMNGTNYLVKDDAISRLEIMPEEIKDNQVQSLLMKINGSYSSKISLVDNNSFGYVKFIHDNFIYNLPHDKIHDILILGAGGFTIGLNDDKNNYTYLDVEKNLQQISEEKFLNRKLGKNKQFIFQDAYLFMLNDKNKYDLIVVDVYSSLNSIPLNFVTTNFFTMVKNHLKPNGIMIANIITSPNFDNKFSRRVDNTLRNVFKQYLNRQVLQPELPQSNVEYVYYNYPEDNTIYTLDKSSAMYGQ